MSSGSVYQVGVHLMARDGVSGVLANISRSVLGLHGSVEHLQKGFKSLNAAILGAGAVAAGVAIGHVTAQFVESGLEMQHWKSQMMAAGATSQQVAAAVSRSWEVAGSNVNTTATDNLKNIIELNKATGNWAESTKLLPIFSQAETVLSSVKAEGLRSRMVGNTTQTLNFARGLEELGVTSMGRSVEEREANIKRYAAEFMKTMIASRGLFDGNQLYAMTNQSAQAARRWDMNMATTVAPILGEIMKAGKLGNADYMSIRTFQGGTITSKAAKALVDNHLAKLGDEDDKSADVYQDKKGYHLKANSAFANGMDVNLWDWSGRILAQLRANGVNIGDSKAISGVVNEIGSNKSVSMIMRMLLDPLTRMQIQKEMAARDRVTDDAVGIQQANDPTLKIEAFWKKWDDFKHALGDPLVDQAMNVLDRATATINHFAQELHQHADVAEAITKTMALTSAILVLGGTLAIGSTIAAALGPAGWLVLGIGGLAAAFKLFAPGDFDKWLAGFKQLGHGLLTFNWDEIKTGVKTEWEACIAALGKLFTAAIDTLPDKTKDAVWRAVSKISDYVKDALNFFTNGDHAKSSDAPQGKILGPDDPGYQQNAYRGGGGLYHEIGFDGGTTPPIFKTMADKVVDSFREALGLSAGGSGGGGFGGTDKLIKASYGGGGLRDGDGGSGRGGNFSGSQMARGVHAMSFLMGRGWTREAAASAISQAMEESNIRSDGPAGDHGTAHGMFQWRGQRFLNLLRYAAQQHKSWKDFDTQLGFFDAEQHGRFGDAWKHVQNLRMGGHFGKRFEGYGTDTFNDRLANSRTLLQHAPSHTVTVPPPPRSGQSQKIEVHLNVSKKRLASHVIEAMLDGLSGPSRGGQMPDDSRANYGTASAFNSTFA